MSTDPKFDPGRSLALDKTMFLLAVVTALLVSVPLIFFSEGLGPFIIDLYDWVAEHLGLVFQWATIGAMIVVARLIFSRYGAIRFGDAAEKPEFRTLSWIAMLFTAGVGGGLLYWAGIEWAYYYAAPPMGARPESAEAVAWATRYGLFHWGLAAWSLYALPTIAIGYAYYVRGIPHLRLSAAVVGHRCDRSAWAKVVDFCFMVGLIGGAGTSLALSAPVISAGIAQLSGTPRTNAMDAWVIVFCVSLFGASVYLGLEKGIKRLADLNLYLSFAFLAFVLVVGPTAFILKTGTESIGGMLGSFFDMLTWTDAVGQSSFVKDWTIFYWAWWIAFAPYVGLFVTRISRGRTIREVGLGMLVFGSLGAWAFYIVLGNFALHLELSDTLPVASMVNDDAPAAIVAVIGQLPLGAAALAIFITVISIFSATTYDSASYSLAATASLELHTGHHPARWHRLFWAATLGVMPVGLLFVGGLKVVQSAVLLSALPIAIIGIFLTRTLFRWLREHPQGPQ